LKRSPLRKKRKVKIYRKVAVPRGYMSLKDECWKIQSEIIRRKAKGVCFTCKEKKDWKDCDAGHFKHGCMDFVRKNVHCQCKKCNKYLHGNLDVYALRLIENYGNGIIEELDKLKWTSYEPNYEELQILRANIKEELAQINDQD